MNSILIPFSAGFALCAALIVAIGAQNLFVLRQGLLRQHVGPVVAFCIAADASLITLGVSGVAAFLRSMPQLTSALSLGGAGFLGWYGVQAFHRMARGEAVNADAGTRQRLGQVLATLAGFTFLNPHVYLDTVLLMGAAGATYPAPLRVHFIAGAASASACWFLLLGYGARLLQPVFARPLAWRVLDGLVGVTMLGMAAMLALPLLRFV
ncbi:amino acid transporter [Novosphingobium umbonatum]|uniref:Amino acid transporter n=1 Tax=Novosphingobium umbonatum TaxID=1908524 RepID=A0A437N7E7_9SPHN|nr:LysE/ArgO family amino acid transporter [Novosphingobium umbonatum]RVU05818.1 amino acid transporter [Novosphingobium umbonatum]